MNLTSREMSIELKKAGVEQDSYWCIRLDEYNNESLQVNPKFDTFERLQREKSGNYRYYSAFSVSELLERLTNDEIEKYAVEYPKGTYYTEILINLFRSPDKLAEVLLYKLK